MIELFTRTAQQPNTAQLASKLDAALRKQATAQAEVDRAQAALTRATEVVDQLRSALNQQINPPSSRYQDPSTPTPKPTPSITQSNPSPTQAAGVLHRQPMQTPTTNRPAQANPPQHAISNKPVANSVPAQRSSSTLSTKYAPEVPANKVTTVRGMEAMLSNRVQYHTEAVCIVSVKDEGLLKMYPHYVSGDGVNNGIPTPEGYEVEHKVSAKTGKPYRQVYIPALQITCTLEQPLPADLIQCKEALREWLKANEYLRGVDSNKFQFTTDYDYYKQEYSPYVCVDGKGTTLYVYIGAESLSSTTPAPTLIA